MIRDIDFLARKTWIDIRLVEEQRIEERGTIGRRRKNAVLNETKQKKGKPRRSKASQQRREETRSRSE